MKRKHFRMLKGIILHPFKRVFEFVYRPSENEILKNRAEGRDNYKMWRRMHDMSDVTNTGYTTSDLLPRIGSNRFVCC